MLVYFALSVERARKNSAMGIRTQFHTELPSGAPIYAAISVRVEAVNQNRHNTHHWDTAQHFGRDESSTRHLPCDPRRIYRISARCVQNIASFSIDWYMCEVLRLTRLLSVQFWKCTVLLFSTGILNTCSLRVTSKWNILKTWTQTRVSLAPKLRWIRETGFRPQIDVHSRLMTHVQRSLRAGTYCRPWLLWSRFRIMPTKSDHAPSLQLAAQLSIEVGGTLFQ